MASVTSQSDTSGSKRKASMSVWFETRGNFITPILSFPLPSEAPRIQLMLITSSPSITTSLSQGITPTTLTPVFSSVNFTASSKRDMSPRNLLKIIPLTLFLSSPRSSNVPTTDAIAPPLSTSATSRTGISASRATLILTISAAFKFTSAGLPAPSETMRSKFSSMCDSAVLRAFSPSVMVKFL